MGGGGRKLFVVVVSALAIGHCEKNEYCVTQVFPIYSNIPSNIAATASFHLLNIILGMFAEYC